MVDFEECGNILDDIADEMPVELYRDLSGGILLLNETKLHPKAVNNDLYILGLYVRNSIGRHIEIYYGSISRVYGHLSKERLTQKLRDILRHEVRHHNEFLAGVDDLCDYDREQIDKYLENKTKGTS